MGKRELNDLRKDMTEEDNALKRSMTALTGSMTEKNNALTRSMSEKNNALTRSMTEKDNALRTELKNLAFDVYRTGDWRSNGIITYEGDQTNTFGNAINLE